MRNNYFAVGLCIAVAFLLVVGCQQTPEASPNADVPSPSSLTTNAVVPASEPTTPPATPTAAAVAPPKSPTPAPTILVPEVDILGKEGFDPMLLTLEVGESVIWVNYDTQGARLTFTKDNQEVFTSTTMVPKATYTHTFEEPGMYEYSIPRYGVKGKVLVR